MRTIETEIFEATNTGSYEKFELWRMKKLEVNSPESGVYIFSTNKSIGRLLGTDSKGILYIGKGIILPYHNRIGKFVNTINATESAHSGGARYTMKRIQDLYPLKESTIEVVLSETPEEVESRLLDDYFKEFGELPPLN